MLEGIAVLKATGHNPPINAVTTWCGLISVLTALYGGISTRLTGPVNAILVASGDPRRHWLAASLLGVMVILFGLCAPTVTSWANCGPCSFSKHFGRAGLGYAYCKQHFNPLGPDFPLGGLIAFLVTLGVYRCSTSAPRSGVWCLVW